LGAKVVQKVDWAMSRIHKIIYMCACEHLVTILVIKDDCCAQLAGKINFFLA
jgi:hypothetical protein